MLLNSPNPELTRKSIWDLSSQAEMLDRMELGPEAGAVTHVGGTYGDVRASRARWVETWPTLPEHVRQRLVLEHDDIRFSANGGVAVVAAGAAMNRNGGHHAEVEHP